MRRSPIRIVVFVAMVALAVAAGGAAAAADAQAAAAAGHGGPPGQSPSADGAGPVAWSAGSEWPAAAAQDADCEASPVEVEPGEEVTFDASGTTDATSVEFDVDGDGDYDVEDSDDFVVTWHYREVGTYETVVRAHGAGDVTATADCGTVVVGNQPPTANISYEPSEPVTNQPITFDGTNSTDPDGNVTDYEWYVDGEFLTGEPVFEYTTDVPGTYRVTLVVTDDDGESGETTTNVTIESNEPPTAAFSASPSPATVGQNVTFDAGDSSDPDGEVVEYRWDLDGDGVVDEVTDGPTVTHRYDEAGFHSVTLEVVDDDGATDATGIRVDVEQSRGEPVARCRIEPVEIGPDETAVIDARETTNASYLEVDVDGDGTYDRTVEGEFVIEVAYEEPGNYEPRVRAVNELEGADAQVDTAVCGQITVGGNEPPTAVLDVEPATVDPDEPVTLDATDSSDPDGEVVEYRWDLDGDGVVDEVTDEPTVTHRYEAVGSVAATVTVVDDDGATDDASVTVDVGPPVARCSVSATAVAPGENVSIDASNSTNADAVRFDVDGDGSFERTASDAAAVAVAYDEAGNVTPRVLVTNAVGRDVATCGTIEVSRSGPPLEELLLPLLFGGLIGGGVALLSWAYSARSPRRREPRRTRYPKPKPTLLGDDAAYYAAGTFEVPAVGTSTVSVADVGFEPDLLLLTTTNASRIDAFPERSQSWSSGVAMRTPDGIEQHVTVVADDALSTDQATISTTDGDALAAVRHGEGPPAHVRGRVASTSPDGFDVVVSGPDEETGDARIGVLYRAFNLPYEVEFETGHFRTPGEPGSQVIELGIEADHVAFTASSAVGALDRRWTTDRSVGLSMGVAVGPEPVVQTVRNGTAWPGHDAGNAAFGGTDRAIHLLYRDGDRIAGRTTATVRELGERLVLRYDRLYSGPEKIGWTDPHVVSYVAMDSAGMVRPAVGAFRLPGPGEAASVDVGFEPGMVEFATCGAGQLGAQRAPAALSGPFGWSHGVAVDGDDGLVQYVLQGTGAATPPPGPTVAGAVDPAAATAGATAGEAATDGSGHGANATPDGPGDEVNATPDGRVAVSLPVDDDGVIAGRDDLRVEAFTDDGFSVGVESVGTDARSPDEETKPYVFYRAWPAMGEDVGAAPTAAVAGVDGPSDADGDILPEADGDILPDADGDRAPGTDDSTGIEDGDGA